VSARDAGALHFDDVEPGPSVVTIGNFDGVHRGHQVLLRRAVDAARDRGVRSVAITFDPHPAAVLRPGSEPLALQTLEDRVAALHETGVDVVLVLSFSRSSRRSGRTSSSRRCSWTGSRP
jgi:riboflavin kinase / FMN adenylyltransferase